jgi:transposase
LIKIEFTTADQEALRYWRFHHAHPRVQRKMEALYLKSQGLRPEQITRLCDISNSTFYRYLAAYRAGGIDRLKESDFHRQSSQLAEYRAQVEADMRAHPPASVAEASARIASLTGITRGPTQVRQFLRSIGMKPRKVGQIPAKADVEAQEQFKTEQLEPRLEEAKAGQRVVFFVDAAHFVYAPFLGLVWCFERLFVKAPSGRQRLNVLAALNATTREIFTVKNLTYVTAETVCELLRLVAGAHPGMPITIVLDNARYQRCALVQSVAARLGIELLFLPAYSPNLNLIERFWKFVKKQCLYSKYYADSASFQQAILECIEGAPSRHKDVLAQLLTLKFHSFKEVPVLGEESNVCLFPVVKQVRRKVSSKAA